MTLGLDRGVSDLRRLSGADRGRQRFGEPPSRVPVVGQFGQRQRRVLAEGQLRVGGEGRGDTLVQGGSLAGQQVVVHGLVAEGVAERVQLAGPHHQLAAHRLAQGRVDRCGVEVGDIPQERVAHPAADHRGDAQQPLRRRVDAGDALENDVTDRRRQVGAPAGGDELLDEERIAISPIDDPVQQSRCRLGADDPTDQLADLLPTKRTEVHLHGPSGTHQLADGDRQAVRSDALGRPPRRHHDDGRRTHGVGHEQQEIARRLVGPMQVLDEDDERSVRGRGEELTGDPGEEPEAIGRVGGRGHPAIGAITGGQVAKDLGERCIRDGVGERQAGPGEHVRPSSASPGDELLEQP